MPTFNVPSFSKQEFRIAPETKYGVIGTSFKRINSMRLMLEPTFDTEQFAPSGVSVPMISAVNDDYTQGDLEGKADYNAVIYPLATLLGAPVITIPGGGTNSRQWDFAWDGKTPYVPQSYSVQTGHVGDAEQALGCLFNGFGISGSRDGMDAESDLFGLAISTGNTMGGATNEVQTLTITGVPTGGTFTLAFRGETSDPIAFDATAAAVQTALEAMQQLGPGNVTATGTAMPAGSIAITFIGALGGINVPSIVGDGTLLTGGTTPTVVITPTTPGADTVGDILAVPMFPLHFSLYMDDTWAGLGTTKLLQTFDMDFSFGEKFERTKPINRLRDSDGYVEMADQEHELTLAFAIDATEKALIAKIRSGGMKFIRIEATSDPAMIEGAIPYLFRLDLACFIKEAAPADELDSIYVREFTFGVGRDAVSNNAVAAQVVNTRTAL